MSKPASRPADRTTWRKLIEPAFRVVASLEASGYGKLDYRRGGGTVLMLRFDHRISKDADSCRVALNAAGHHVWPFRDLLTTQTGQRYAMGMRDRLLQAVAEVDGQAGEDR